MLLDLFLNQLLFKVGIYLDCSFIDMKQG